MLFSNIALRNLQRSMQNISKRLILAIIVLIIALVAGGLFWYASVQERQAQVEVTLQQQKDELKLQEESLISQISKDGEVHLGIPRITPIDGKGTDWYEIPELGVKFELNSKYAHNLMYSVRSYRIASNNIQGVGVDFLSKDSVVAGCDLNELSYGADGNLSRLNITNISDVKDDGTPSTNLNPLWNSNIKGKQFEQFYLYSEKNPETCVPVDYIIKESNSPSPYKGSGAIFIDINQAKLIGSK